MNTSKATRRIDRRRFLSVAGLAAASVGSLLPLRLAAAGADTAVSPQATPLLVPGITRTDLLRDDLSAPGREVIQVLVGFAPATVAPNHTHPGEELVYVVEGLLEYALEGRPPVTVGAGEVLFIPAGVAHAVRNVGRGNAAELATYIVEKGKPLATLVA
jgi:quercetin dioxygenase-like cupin family protein